MNSISEIIILSVMILGAGSYLGWQFYKLMTRGGSCGCSSPECGKVRKHLQNH